MGCYLLLSAHLQVAPLSDHGSISPTSESSQPTYSERVFVVTSEVLLVSDNQRSEEGCKLPKRENVGNEERGQSKKKGGPRKWASCDGAYEQQQHRRPRHTLAINLHWIIDFAIAGVVAAELCLERRPGDCST